MTMMSVCDRCGKPIFEPEIAAPFMASLSLAKEKDGPRMDEPARYVVRVQGDLCRGCTKRVQRIFLDRILTDKSNLVSFEVEGVD